MVNKNINVVFVYNKEYSKIITKNVEQKFWVTHYIKKIDNY